MFSVCLQQVFKFDKVFSNWLSKNLHNLNETSALLLKNLNQSSEVELRFSTIVQTLTEGELKVFCMIMKGVSAGMSMNRRTVLLQGIDTTCTMK